MSAGADGFTVAALEGLAATVARADEGLGRALERLADRTTIPLAELGARLGPGFAAEAALALAAEVHRPPPTQYLALPLEVLETADALTGPGAGDRIIAAWLAAHAFPGPLGFRCERIGRTDRTAVACLLPADHPNPCPAGAIIDRALELEAAGMVLELEDDGEFEQLVGALSPEGFEHLPDGWTAEELYAHHGLAELLPWARRIAAAAHR